MNAAMKLAYKRDVNDPLVTFCPDTLLMRGDKGANIIELTVMDGSSPADLSGHTAVVMFQRPGDSDKIRCPGSIFGNVISVTLPGDCYAYSGQYYASLVLNADGFTRTMLRLAGHVENNGDGPVIDPTGTIPGYEDIARIYAELEASLKRSDAATDSANSAAQNANEKAAIADTAAGNANTAAGNANAGAGRANAAAESIEGLTISESVVEYGAGVEASVTRDPESGALHVAIQTERGPQGPGYTIKGPAYATVAELEAAVPSPDVGDQYNVGAAAPYNVYRWTGAGWEDQGTIQGPAGTDAPQINDDEALSTNPWSGLKTKEEIAKVEGKIYPCTAQALEAMTQEQQAELYTQGYRAVQTTNNETIVTLALAADGSLEWQGCNEDTTNLLDNPDFAIAQAGYGGAHGTQVYAADRWGKTDGSATFSSAQGGGIAIAVTQPGHIFQRIEKVVPGETYTVAASVNGAVYVASGTWPESGSSFGVDFPGGSLYVEHDYGVVVYFASGVNIQWVRLLSGSYTAKTLPPWEAPNNAVELIKCRKYYRKGASYLAIATNISSNGYAVQNGGTPPMRVNPTCTITNIYIPYVKYLTPSSTDTIGYNAYGPYDAKLPTVAADSQETCILIVDEDADL